MLVITEGMVVPTARFLKLLHAVVAALRSGLHTPVHVIARGLHPVGPKLGSQTMAEIDHDLLVFFRLEELAALGKRANGVEPHADAVALVGHRARKNEVGARRRERRLEHIDNADERNILHGTVDARSVLAHVCDGVGRLNPKHVHRTGLPFSSLPVSQASKMQSDWEDAVKPYFFRLYLELPRRFSFMPSFKYSMPEL